METNEKGVQQPSASATGSGSTALAIVKDIDLSGRNAIVTGGASGIGIETVRALASAGARVTIAARDLDAAKRVAEAVNARLDDNRVAIEQLELGDLRSIRRFAEKWGANRLDLLICNAGVMACPLSYTADGFETQIGVNHLGHFALANLLVPALIRGAPSRVVVLSSGGHRHSDIDLDDLHFRHRDYNAVEAYGQSKAANALFALEFDRRLASVGIRAFAVSPGGVATALMRHMTDAAYKRMGAVPVNERPADSLKTPEAGAATSVWAAVKPGLESFGGLYLENCALVPPFGPEHPRGVMPYASDPVRARELWERSEAETGVAAAV